MNIIIFLIILLVLVLVHEFGHFFSAKKFGIRVDEFGFGFPPKLYGRKYGETEYSFNLFPIGGFVKIFGENPDDENTNGPDRARSFVHKPKYQQAIVLFAGVFANFLLAWLLFSVGFMSGFPTSVGNAPAGQELKDVNLVIVSVLPDSPAEASGLKTGDKIIFLSTENKKDLLKEVSAESMQSFIALHGREEIEIGYVRGKSDGVDSYDSLDTIKVTPKNNDGKPMIGVSMDEIGIAKLPVLSAIKEGLWLTAFVAKGTFSGLYGLIADGLQGKGSLSTVTGPVGLVGIVGDAYDFGLVYLLSFTAIISVNLAIINLVPFPALDGGRLFFLLIEKIKGSRINPKITNTANAIGFGLLVLLMLVVTFKDVARLF